MPASREVKSSGDQLRFEVDACVLYGDAIYKATFEVLADGSIAMMHDKKIVSTQVQESPIPLSPLDRVIPLPASKLESELPLESDLAFESKLSKESGQSSVVKNLVLTGQLTQEPLHTRVFAPAGSGPGQPATSRYGPRTQLRECVFEHGLDLSGRV